MTPSREATSRLQPGLVSAVMAVHNGARFLEQACRSVLAQTYRSLELIVVDDGSTDDTSAIVARLAASESRIRPIRQSNLGVSAARNRAIREASGEFLAAIDADDVWDPTKLARQVQRLQEAGLQTGMVYCWWVWIDEHGNVQDRSPQWDVEGAMFERLVEVNFMGGASVPLFRRSSVEQVGGYDATLRGCEDWDLALRVARRFDVAAVPAALVGYRRTPNSLSTHCDTMWRSHQRVVAALATAEPSMPPAVLRQSTGQFRLYLSGIAFGAGRYRDACHWAFRARPLTLVLATLPYFATMLAKRLLRRDGARTPRLPEHGPFEALDLPEPHVPYDRIYARHWGAP